MDARELRAGGELVWTVRSGGPEETSALGRAIGRCARAGDAVLLRGPVGAGKTVLAGGVLDGLGIAGPHPSPTFTLVRIHAGGRVPAVHADLYRLAGAFPAEEVGWEDLADGSAVLVVEWAEQLGPWTPADALWVDLDVPGDAGAQSRTLAFGATGPGSARLLREVRSAWARRGGS